MLIGCDRLTAMLGDIHVAGVRPSCGHPLPALACVAHQHGEPTGVLGGAMARPADAGRMIQPILLLAVGVIAAGGHQPFEDPVVACQPHLMHLTVVAPIAVVGALEVWQEQAGVTLTPQQDEGIGQRLEPSLDQRLKRLQGLGVVVLHQRHGQVRQVAHQRSIQQATQVVARAMPAG